MMKGIPLEESLSNKRLSLLEEPLNEEGLLNSLLDLDFDAEGEFCSEQEDLFSFPKQKILEDILKE